MVEGLGNINREAVWTVKAAFTRIYQSANILLQRSGTGTPAGKNPGMEQNIKLAEETDLVKEISDA